jgi:hypothetical protein
MAIFRKKIKSLTDMWLGGVEYKLWFKLYYLLFSWLEQWPYKEEGRVYES